MTQFSIATTLRYGPKLRYALYHAGWFVDHYGSREEAETERDRLAATAPVRRHRPLGNGYCAPDPWKIMQPVYHPSLRPRIEG